MKRLVSILLLFIFLFNTVGYYFVFKIKQSAIEHEVYEFKKSFKNFLFNHKPFELTQIKVLKNEVNKLHFEKNKQELIYNGDLFDIVKTEQTETEVIFYCLSDKKEEHLFASLEKHIDYHVKDTKDSKKSHSKTISITHLNLFYQNAQTFTFSNEFLSILFPEPNLAYSFNLFEINSPPPELV